MKYLPQNINFIYKLIYHIQNLTTITKNPKNDYIDNDI